ncbi:MAG: AmmeMemoRadiSam system protein B [Metallosphaera sp.]
MPVRRPAVAGSFYEDEPQQLKKRIEWSFLHNLGPGEIPQERRRNRKNPLFIVPHAGYIYSGPIASNSYYYLVQEGKPDLVIVLGPNHTGYGSWVSIWPEGEWRTPLGSYNVDQKLVKELVSVSEVIDIDEKAHLYEHSIEVQLPFLQYFFNDLRILPIVVLMQTPEIAESIAEGIWRFINRHSDLDIVVLASSDLNHYDPHEVTMAKDDLVIRKVEELDHKGLYRVIEEQDVTVCGYAPIMVSLILAKKMNKRPYILRHATSGDTSGDKSSVVGYLAARFGD